MKPSMKCEDQFVFYVKQYFSYKEMGHIYSHPVSKQPVSRHQQDKQLRAHLHANFTLTQVRLRFTKTSSILPLKVHPHTVSIHVHWDSNSEHVPHLQSRSQLPPDYDRLCMSIWSPVQSRNVCVLFLGSWEMNLSAGQTNCMNLKRFCTLIHES